MNSSDYVGGKRSLMCGQKAAVGLALAMVGTAIMSGPAWGQNTFPATGNVGIGTSSPGVPLAVVAGPAGTGSAEFGLPGENLSNTTRGISLKSDAAVAIAVGQSTVASVGMLWYPNSAGEIYTFGNAYPLIYSASYHSFAGNAYFNNPVGIGITSLNPAYQLMVNGAIAAKDVTVTNTGWPDYVFSPTYRLLSLDEVSAYIQSNHHLPGIPSEAEVKEKGVSVSDMQAKLLAKVEELTLHMIEQEKQNLDLRERIATLEAAPRGK